MKKFKIPLFMLAFCLALAASFAFSLPQKDAKQFSVYYYEETSTNFNVMSNAGNWDTGLSPHGDCNATEGSIPCAITYEGGDFAGFLAGLETSEAIVTEADTKRYP